METARVPNEMGLVGNGVPGLVIGADSGRFRVARLVLILSIGSGWAYMIFDQLAPGRFVIRLEKEDDILVSIKRFAEARRIRSAMFEGIGSLNRAKLGHYDFATKKYTYETFEEDLEILTLSGNISILDKSPLPHAHVTLGRRNFTVIGGHLDDGSSANMVEIGLSAMPGKLVKSKDERVGLNLLQLPKRL